MRKASITQREILPAIFILLFLCYSVFIPAVSAGSGLKSAIGGLEQSASQAFDGSPRAGGPESGITDIPVAVGTIVGAILAFVGVIFFILMVYGGFTWMLARGNEQEVAKAKDMIFSAVIGLIIVLAAYAITAYIGDALTA